MSTAASCEQKPSRQSMRHPARRYDSWRMLSDMHRLSGRSQYRWGYTAPPRKGLEESSHLRAALHAKALQPSRANTTARYFHGSERPSARERWCGEPATLRSKCPNQSKRISRLDSLEPLTSAESPDVGARIRKVVAVFPDANECCHRLAAISDGSSVAIPHRLPDQLGDGCMVLSRPNVQNLPYVFIKIQLSAFHDV